MTDVVKEPPQEVRGLCELLYDAAGGLLRDVNDPFPDEGRYESDTEARVLFWGLLRHFEALLELAQRDLVLLPAAGTIARATFEQGLRIRWLLHPETVYDREARFLGHLATEERMWDGFARHGAMDSANEGSEWVRGFRTAVEEKLPQATRRVAGVPALTSILEELGEPKRYVAYIFLSQYAHGTHASGAVYREHLGIAKEFREKVDVSDWAFLLKISWWSIFNAAQAIEHTSASRSIRSIESRELDLINQLLSELGGSTQHGAESGGSH